MKKILSSLIAVVAMLFVFSPAVHAQGGELIKITKVIVDQTSGQEVTEVDLSTLDKVYNFKITVENVSAEVFTNVQIVDSLPASLVFDAQSPTPDALENNSVLWSIDTFSPGDVMIFHYDAKVARLNGECTNNVANVVVNSSVVEYAKTRICADAGNVLGDIDLLPGAGLISNERRLPASLLLVELGALFFVAGSVVKRLV
ncbi:hypothetical protein KC614_04270 [candidate division WWE3 bacterium]|uniref:DUF11 domain-containing protein n=1 Tax=candidate division WWE3 bacterium TaxID=2053526 RepID=A0A955LLF8_UNCKA|nr:hypothetical protein [candidate division WWE3 bacterium]